MTTELVPEQILPKVMSTFGLTAAYVFIICWVTGSSVMAAGGWTAIPMWVLGILTFLIPAGMAVVELGNLWPGQGGVYIWATRTMGETWGFIGGYLSWVPVILNAASSPAVVLQFLLLAFHTELGLTTSIILQLVILWTVIGLALAKLAANQKIMNVVFVVYGILTLTIFICGVLFATKNGSATPFSMHDATVPNFAVAGFLYGTVLLYLLGVETPYNMGAEFLSVRKSGPRMILWGSTALVAIYLLTTLGTMMALPGDQIDPVTGVIGALGSLGLPRSDGDLCGRAGRHHHRGADDLPGRVLPAHLRLRPGAAPPAGVHAPQPAYPQPGDRDPDPGCAVVADPGGAVLAEQHGERDHLPAGRPEHGVAAVGLLLPVPAHLGEEEVRRSLCQRDVLAHPRRHGRGVDRRRRRHARHHRRRLLLVRDAVDRRSAVHLDDVGRRHQPGHVRARIDRVRLRPPLGAQGEQGRLAGPSGRLRHEEV